MGAATRPIETDALVIGAGPVGLFQVFQLGLLGIKAQVVDSLPHAGGQCVELYADKPIYDIPALKVVSGRELTERLLLQIEPFGAGFCWNQEVAAIRKQDDGRFEVSTGNGTQFLAKVIVIAAGVGSFQPRKLKIDGIAPFEGSQVLYRTPDLSTLAAQRVLVTGDEDAALQCAISLATADHTQPAAVTLMHRRDAFRAEPALVAQMRELVEAGKIELLIAQPNGVVSESGRLTGLTVLTPEGASRTHEADMVLALLGISPKLGPIAEWGLAMERKQLTVDTETFTTSERGIFAVGDINTYPGKKKLIVCGFHECVLAAFGAAAIVFPHEKTQLQYTTTSPRLHERLGVAGVPSQSRNAPFSAK